jgi:hypothetical protein
VKILLIVDLQVAFPVPPKLVELVERVAAEARRYDRRIFTCFMNTPDSLFRRHLKMTACAPDTLDRAGCGFPGLANISSKNAACS